MLKFFAPVVAALAIGVYALPTHSESTPAVGSELVAQCKGKKDDKPATDAPKPSSNCDGNKKKGKKDGEGTDGGTS